MHIEVRKEDGEFLVWAATEEGEVGAPPSFVLSSSENVTEALRQAELELLEGLDKVRALMRG